MGVIALAIPDNGRYPPRMPVYAQFTKQHAYLNSDFGLDYACRVFNMNPESIEKTVGRYTRGKRKGQLRGSLNWFKCSSGGWLRGGDGYMGAYGVVKPNERAGHYIDNYDGDVLIGQRHDTAYTAWADKKTNGALG